MAHYNSSLYKEKEKRWLFFLFISNFLTCQNVDCFFCFKLFKKFYIVLKCLNTKVWVSSDKGICSHTDFVVLQNLPFFKNLPFFYNGFALKILKLFKLKKKLSIKRSKKTLSFAKKSKWRIIIKNKDQYHIMIRTCTKRKTKDDYSFFSFSIF